MNSRVSLLSSYGSKGKFCLETRLNLVKVVEKAGLFFPRPGSLGSMRFRLSPSTFTLAITSNPLLTFAAQNVLSGNSEVQFWASGLVLGEANGEASTIGPYCDMQREIHFTAQLQAQLDARQC